LQCVAVCCSVLRRVYLQTDAHFPESQGIIQIEVCCSTLLCSVLQCVAVCCSVLQCVAVCCSVLQCVAVCCSVLQCAAVFSPGD